MDRQSTRPEPYNIRGSTTGSIDCHRSFGCYVGLFLGSAGRKSALCPGAGGGTRWLERAVAEELLAGVRDDGTQANTMTKSCVP